MESQTEPFVLSVAASGGYTKAGKGGEGCEDFSVFLLFDEPFSVPSVFF